MFISLVLLIILFVTVIFYLWRKLSEAEDFHMNFWQFLHVSILSVFIGFYMLALTIGKRFHSLLQKFLVN